MSRFYFIVSLMVISLNLFSQMRPGQTAADLSLPDLNGKITTLSELKGKVVLIDFWASWCGPCRRNNPHLSKLYKKYHEKGLEIFGVSLDDDVNSWKKAVKHDRLDWIQVIDDKGWDSAAARLYGVDMIPSSFLLDRHGVIQTVNAEGPELENSVRDLLKD